MSNNSSENELFELSELQKAYYLGEHSGVSLGGLHASFLTAVEVSALDLARFELAVNAVVMNHDMLRAVIRSPKQGEVLSKIPQVSIQQLSFETKMEFENYFDEVYLEQIDLSRFPSFKFIYCCVDNKFILMFKSSLFFLDGLSTEKFIQDVIEQYNDAILESGNEQAFKEFIEGLSLQKKKFFKDEAYWQSQNIKDGHLDYLPHQDETYVSPIFSSVREVLSKDLSDSIRLKSKNYGISMATLLSFAYAKTLMKYSYADEAIINIVGSYRRRPKNALGNFGRPFPLKVSANFNGLTILEELKETSRHLKCGAIHDLYTINDVIAEHGMKDGSRRTMFPFVFSPLLDFDESFSLINLPGGKLIRTRSATAQVWIDCQVFQDKEGCVVIKWDYVNELFDCDFIKRMHHEYFALILELIHSDWEAQKLEQKLSEKEFSLIKRANSSVQPEAEDTLVDICFKDLNKHDVAVIDELGKHSYETVYLNSQSVTVGLLGLNCQEGDLVAVLSEKCCLQLVSCLGVMQARCAYLPLHVDWPLGRIEGILKEGLVKTVLVSKKQYDSLIKGSHIKSNFTWLIIEELISDNIEHSSISFPEVKKTDLAYVIFTSGSTGKPKGVAISHEGAVNTILAVNKRFQVGSNDKVLALSELSFDLSVYDMFGLLAAGGTIVYPSQAKTKNPEHWLELIKANNITVWNTVPQLMQILVDHAREKDERLDCIKTILMSGDWVPLRLADQIKELSNDVTVMSLGGATEGSVWSIWYEINEVEKSWSSIPYGTAMPNQTMNVLSAQGELCPIGVVGEIHIGGSGVALGYWQDQEKTDKQFVKNKQLGRVYKTGDLGRWHEEGYIEFIGRKDNQVKLNGYRVELGEINDKLTNIESVSKALAVVQKNNLKAYLVLKDTDGGKEFYLADSSLKQVIIQNLEDDLPAYMIPGDFIIVKHFPLTANGKVDLKALPVVESKINSFVAPSSGDEKEIAEVWCDILQVSKVGITDSFFSLGGDSIKAIHVLSRLRGLGYCFELKDLFKLKSIKNLLVIKNKLYGKDLTDDETVRRSALLTNVGSTFSESIPNVEKVNFSTSTQEKIFHYLEKNVGDGAYKPQMTLRYDCLFDLEKYLQAWKACIRVNPSFRTIFKEQGGELYQIALLQETLDYKFYDLTHLSREESLEEIKLVEGESLNIQFDLESLPLFHLDVIQLPGQGFSVIVTSNHNIVDGWSAQLLLAQLSQVYFDLTKGLPVKLEESNTYFEAQAFYLKHQVGALSYWSDLLEEQRLVNDLSVLMDKPMQISEFKTVQDSRDIGIPLPKSTLASLVQFSEGSDVTLSSLLQLAWHKFLQFHTSDNQTIAGATVSGRNIPVDGIEKSVGAYFACLPVVVSWDVDQSLSEMVKSLHDQILELNTYQYVDISKLTSKRLFHSAVRFQNYPKLKASGCDDELFEYIPKITGRYEKAGYLFALTIETTADSYTLNLKYDAAYLSEETALRHLNSFLFILNNLLDCKDSLPSEMDRRLKTYIDSLQFEEVPGDRQ